jgi:hypothetical protein
LKLLSRPVVCTNFQGLETNTFFSASAFDQGHSTVEFFDLQIFSLEFLGELLRANCCYVLEYSEVDQGYSTGIFNTAKNLSRGRRRAGRCIPDRLLINFTALVQ